MYINLVKGNQDRFKNLTTQIQNISSDLETTRDEVFDRFDNLNASLVHFFPEIFNHSGNLQSKVPTVKPRLHFFSGRWQFNNEPVKLSFGRRPWYWGLSLPHQLCWTHKSRDTIWGLPRKSWLLQRSPPICSGETEEKTKSKERSKERFRTVSGEGKREVWAGHWYNSQTEDTQRRSDRWDYAGHYSWHSGTTRHLIWVNF